MAYDQLDPFGEPREDWRSGMIAATVANVNRDPDKKREPFTPQDFMIDLDHHSGKPVMSPEQSLALVRSWMPPLKEE